MKGCSDERALQLFTCSRGPPPLPLDTDNLRRPPTPAPELRTARRTPGLGPTGPPTRPQPRPRRDDLGLTVAVRASVPTHSCVKCLRGQGATCRGGGGRGPVRRLGRARGPGGSLRERQPVPQSGRVSESLSTGSSRLGEDTTTDPALL